MSNLKKEKDGEYFTEYPKCIEIPKGYWVFSHDVGYVESN